MFVVVRTPSPELPGLIGTFGISTNAESNDVRFAAASGREPNAAFTQQGV